MFADTINVHNFVKKCLLIGKNRILKTIIQEIKKCSWFLKKFVYYKNVNKIEQNFANSINVHEWKNVLKIQKLLVYCQINKIIYSSIKCSLIKKWSCISKNVPPFDKSGNLN